MYSSSKKFLPSALQAWSKCATHPPGVQLWRGQSELGGGGGGGGVSGVEEEVKGAQLFALTDVQAKGGKVDKDGLAKRNTMTHLKRCSSGGVLYSSHKTVYMLAGHIHKKRN